MEEIITQDEQNLRDFLDLLIAFQKKKIPLAEDGFHYLLSTKWL